MQLVVLLIPGWEQMQIISRRKLRNFWEDGHADAEAPLKAWHADARVAKWTRMMDIKARYASASIIDNERVVFNLSGNKYRLVVKVYFPDQVMFVKFIGTHAEYDKIDVEEL